MLNVYHTIVMRHISDDSYALVVYERLLYIFFFRFIPYLIKL